MPLAVFILAAFSYSLYIMKHILSMFDVYYHSSLFILLLCCLSLNFLQYNCQILICTNLKVEGLQNGKHIMEDLDLVEDHLLVVFLVFENHVGY